MKRLTTNLLMLLLGMLSMQLYAVELNSIYPMKPNDPEAFYFTPENYPIKADGKMDVSDALQAAINQVKKEKNFGILFIPEGKYKISKTIYIPTAIRLIGYGKNRPEFILAKNSPGFQEEVPSDKGKAKYMFWFTGGMVKEGEKPRDAGASTFYSAMSNINLRIEDGNPHAVALRTHFAQHSFINYVAVYIGKGKAGLFDDMNMHATNGLDSFHHIFLPLRIRLVQHTFVPFTNGPRFIGINPGNNEKTILHFVRHLSQTAAVVQYSRLIICRAGSDNQEESIILTGHNISDFLIPFFF